MRDSASVWKVGRKLIRRGREREHALVTIRCISLHLTSTRPCPPGWLFPKPWESHKGEDHILVIRKAPTFPQIPMSPDMINSSQARFFKPLNLDSKLLLPDFELVFHSFKKPRGPSSEIIATVNNHNHHHDWY